MSKEVLVSLLEKARMAGATAADAVCARSVSLSTGMRMGKSEQLERAESTGIGLRVLVGQRVAIVSGSDMRPAALSTLAAQAVAMARASTEDPFVHLAPPEWLCHTPPPLDLDDPHEPEAPWLEAQCAEAEEAARAVQGVTNSEGAEAGYSRNHVTLATSEGFLQSYATTRLGLSVTALAGEGTLMERDYDFASVRHRADLPPPQMLGKRAGERAVARLNPRKVQTQKVPVVFDPRVSRMLVANLAGAINGAAVARGTSFLKDKLGHKLFGDAVNIIDDPHRKRGLASHPFDDEGISTQRRAIIENGVLTTWFLDLRSAAQLKMRTTGHASRGLSSGPSPSPTNLYLAAGTVMPGELMSDIANGFYVTETFGSGGNLVTGDYSAGASGFWIENGKVAYPVSEVTVAGNLLDMFARLTPASDLEFKHGTNAPTVRIDDLMVAGT